MVTEAEAHAGEDKERRERIEKRNSLDSMIYQAEKTLEDAGDKVPGDQKQTVTDAIEAARKDLDSEDAGVLDAAQQRLEQSLHQIAQTLYEAQAAEAGGAAGEAAAPEGSDAPGGEDVVDAEYTEEKGGS
jgi:molecular chaperone DnaK